MLNGNRFRLCLEASRSPRDYGKYEKMRREIWGDLDDHMSGSRNMMCENIFHEGGSLFIAAFAEGPRNKGGRKDSRPAGFSYGFVGIDDKKTGYRDRRNVHFYSQYTGVLRKFQGCGLGRRIKEFQKDTLLNLFGITVVICTFDPLTGVNARRNIHRFGMDISEYRESPYGAFGGLLNRKDVPCDRFLARWDLTRKKKTKDNDKKYAVSSVKTVLSSRLVSVAGKRGKTLMEIPHEENAPSGSGLLYVEIPPDFYRMIRETDVKEPEVRRIPLDWRMATRRVFKALFEKGYRIIDFITTTREGRRKNGYVLKAPRYK